MTTDRTEIYDYSRAAGGPEFEVWESGTHLPNGELRPELRGLSREEFVTTLANHWPALTQAGSDHLAELLGLVSVAPDGTSGKPHTPLVPERRMTDGGRQVVEVDGYAYAWAGSPLAVGNRVLLPPNPAFRHEFAGTVTAIGTFYQGPLAEVSSRITIEESGR